MAEQETIVIRIQGQDDLTRPLGQGTKALTGLQAAARQSTTLLGGLQGAMLKLGAAVAAFYAIKQAFGAVNGAIQAASDLSETINKVDVVFGNSADAIEAWSKTSAQALGMSRNQALSAAGTFGNLFTTIGLGQDVSAKFSQNLIQNAADLASFNNIDPGIVLDKLRAGLVGETEPLRQLGIDVSDAGMKVEALAQGITKSTTAMTQAEKLQLRYAMVQRQMANASGDFARTSTGLANSQRILAAEFQNIEAEIGSRLLPVIAPLVSSIAIALPAAFDKLTPILDTVGAGFASLFGVLSGIGAEIAIFGENLSDSRGILMGFGGAFDALLKDLLDIDTTAFSNFASLIQDNLNPILFGLGVMVATVVVPAFVSMAAAAVTAAGATIAALLPILAPLAAIAAAAALLYAAWDANFLGIRDIVASVLPEIEAFVVNTIGGLIDWWNATLPDLLETVDTVLNSIQTFWEQHGEAIIGIVVAGWDIIVSVVETAAKLLGDVISIATNLMEGNWLGAWQSFMDLEADAWNGIIALAAKAANQVIDIMSLVHQVTGKGIDLAPFKGLVNAIAAGAKVAAEQLHSMRKAIAEAPADPGAQYRTGSTAGKKTAEAWVAAFKSTIAALTKAVTPSTSDAGNWGGRARMEAELAAAGANALKAPAKAAADALGGLGAAARAAGISMADLVSAMIAVHPAMVAAAAAVAGFKAQIETVNLAMRANADQLKAAQAEYDRLGESMTAAQDIMTGLQAHLADLNSQLSTQQARLAALANTQLTGMRQYNEQISAVERQLRRVALAEAGLPSVEEIQAQAADMVRQVTEGGTTYTVYGISTEEAEAQLEALREGALADIMAAFPEMTQEMRDYLSTLPMTADGLQDVLSQLQNMQDLTFDEQLQRIREAANGIPEELDFEEAIRQIAETRANIDSLTGQINVQVAAITAQQVVIDGINASMRAQALVIRDIQRAGDILNETLRVLQEQLAAAELKQQTLNAALALAYQWYTEDRAKMMAMGAEGVIQAGVMDTAVGQLLASVDLAATDTSASATATLQNVVTEYERQMNVAISKVASLSDEIRRIPPTATTLHTTYHQDVNLPSRTATPEEAAVGGTGTGMQYGADFTVRGRGSKDSSLVQFLATPGERIMVIPPSPSGYIGQKMAAAQLIRRGLDFKVTGSGGVDSQMVRFWANRGDRVVAIPTGRPASKDRQLADAAGATNWGGSRAATEWVKNMLRIQGVGGQREPGEATPPGEGGAPPWVKIVPPTPQPPPRTYPVPPPEEPTPPGAPGKPKRPPETPAPPPRDKPPEEPTLGGVWWIPFTPPAPPPVPLVRPPSRAPVEEETYYGAKEPRERPLRAQYGLDFNVGGAGGTDSQLVNFMATPGEHVRVTPKPMSGGTSSEIDYDRLAQAIVRAQQSVRPRSAVNQTINNYTTPADAGMSYLALKAKAGR